MGTSLADNLDLEDFCTKLAFTIEQSTVRSLHNSSAWALELLLDINTGFKIGKHAAKQAQRAEFYLAQVYLDRGDFSQAIYLLSNLDNPTSEEAFLYFYAELLNTKRLKNELKNKDQLASSRKNLHLESLLGKLKASSGNYIGDSYITLLLSMYEGEICNFEVAFEYAIQSLCDNPFCFATWEQLACIMVQQPGENIGEKLKPVKTIVGGPLVSLLRLYLEGSWQMDGLDLGSSPVPLLLHDCRFVLLNIALRHCRYLEYRKAEEIFGKLFKKDQFSMSGLDSYSDILFLDGRKNDLEALMLQCIEVNPQHPITFHVSGNYYALNEDYEKAAVNFRRTVRLDPLCSSAWILTAQQYLELRQPEASIDCFLRATEINPKDFRSWYGLGQVYELLDHMSLALEHYTRATRLAPKDFRVHIALGDCYMQRGQNERAIACFQRAVKCPNVSNDIYLRLGAVCMRIERYKEAVVHFRRHLEARPELVHSPTPIDDQPLRSAILAVAQDDQANGDYLKAALWFSLLSRSHGIESLKAGQNALTNKHKDWPVKGVDFYDFLACIADYNSLQVVKRMMVTATKRLFAENVPSNVIFLGIESRGFLLAPLLADHFQGGISVIRKKGRLPGKVIGQAYDKEYGQDVMEISVFEKSNGEKKVIIVDDILASGGTAIAAISLAKRAGLVVCGFISFLELSALDGATAVNFFHPKVPISSALKI